MSDKECVKQPWNEASAIAEPGDSVEAVERMVRQHRGASSEPYRACIRGLELMVSSLLIQRDAVIKDRERVVKERDEARGLMVLRTEANIDLIARLAQSESLNRELAKALDEALWYLDPGHYDPKTKQHAGVVERGKALLAAHPELLK